MTDPVRHMLGHKELTELLIKSNDIHKGTWSIALEFTMAAVMAGPTESEQMPTGMVGIKSVGIQECPVDAPLAVDASKVNPTKKIDLKKSPATKKVAKKA